MAEKDHSRGETPEAKPLKSILKKSKRSTPSREERAVERNKELALHHAHIIQRKKDIEAIVLRSIEELIEFPLHTRDARAPQLSDVQAVKLHLSLFKPTDFDSAVQERNIEEKCGYMLCPKARKKQPLMSGFRIIPGRNIAVVPKEDLEKWCSNDCAKRALYLRVQLSDTPVGERTSVGGLKLYGENEGQEAAARQVDGLATNLGQLAIERGDDMNSFRSKSVSVGIHERSTDTEMAEAPSLPEGGSTHEQIEGFTPGAKEPEKGTWTMGLPVRSRPLNSRGDVLDSI